MNNAANSFNTSPGEKYGLDNLTIQHEALHEILLSKIDLKCIHTGKRLTDIKQEEDSIVLYFEHGSMHTASYLVAADGIRSAVRQKMLPAAVSR